MNPLKVIPIMTNAIGEKKYFLGEPGSPEFYAVTRVLKEYLGEEIQVIWNDNDFVYDIKERDEGCDNSYDYSQIIESIYEPFSPFNYEHQKHDHLTFTIIIFVD